MIQLQPYNSRWPHWFEQEKHRLEASLGSVVKQIEHIGSTAIPGIHAKPVIDILIAVSDLTQFTSRHIEQMRLSGYEYVPDFETKVPSRRYFRKQNEQGESLYQVHVVNEYSAWWHRHLLFRDFLRTHEHYAKEYENEKLALAKHYDDTGLYSDAKSSICQKLETLAFYDFKLNRPLMETARLIGFIPQMACLDDYRSMFQDEQFTRQYGGEVSDKLITQMLSRDVEVWDASQMGPLAWFDRSSYAFVGRAGIKSIMADNEQEIELTYALRPPYWGQGLAAEAGRELLNRAFRDWKLTNVVCFTRPENHRSLGVIDKLGFQFEKEFTHAGTTHWLFRINNDNMNNEA